MFVEASSYYTKDDCYQRAGRCMALADFITVVLKKLLVDSNNNNFSSRDCQFMLNGLYSRSNAEHVMAMFSSCDDAIAVAKACDLQSNWQTFMLSIYRQVIQNHNIEYIETLHASSIMSLPSEAFNLLTKRFQQDSSRSHHSTSFKDTMLIFLERIVTNLYDVDVVLNSISNDDEFRAMGFDKLKIQTCKRLEVEDIMSDRRRRNN